VSRHSRGESTLVIRLRPLARRVRLRHMLERARGGLLLALAGAVLLAVVGRLLGRPEWPLGVSLWGALALGGVLGLALARLPGIWAAARAADALGLAERVTSALYAEQSGQPAAPLLVAQADAALAGLHPSAYALVPRPRRWRPVALLCLLLAAATVAPLPALGDAGRQAAEAGAVAGARRSVEALQAALAEPAQPEPLTQTTAEELRALEERLARADDAAEAARALEEAQERLAATADAEDYAWRRAVESLAGAWAGQPDLDALAQALAAQDPAAVEKAMAELAARSTEMEAAEREALQLGLQTGANAARDVPALAGALRQAASQVGAAAGSAADGQGGADAQRALADLAPQLAQGAARAGGLQAVQRAIAGLGQSRAALGAAGAGAAASGAVAAGPATGSASGGQSAGGDGSGSGAGAGGGDSGTGSGSGDGSGQGSGAGSAGGSGSGAGAGGVGGSGAGAGAGAGAGGGPSPGQPGAGNAGATTSGGNSAPSNSGPVAYDPIYAPSLLGGEGGPSVQAPGDAVGSDGQTVDLPDSPLALGSVRPYDEVYGQYEEAARQALAREPLPPALQGLVQRYFTAVRPTAQNP